MADWTKTNVNGYNVYVYNGHDWTSVKTYTYWEQQSSNDWYALYNGMLIGLTVKMENNVPVYDTTYGYRQSDLIIPTGVEVRDGWHYRYYDKGGSTTLLYSGITNAIESVYFPDGTTFMTGGNGIINSTASLVNVRLPNDFTGEVAVGQGAYDHGPLFPACISLKEVTVPDSMTHLGYASFNGCSSFDTLKIIHTTPGRQIYVHTGVFGASKAASNGLTIYFSCSQTEAENLFVFENTSGEEYTIIQNATKYYNQYITNE